ncbi:MAG: alpha/beta fold hydrolase [candidate division NC10 bacterium]|nr:alpha/beta fold hydrolase [candidate division NC10 bacterium]
MGRRSEWKRSSFFIIWVLLLWAVKSSLAPPLSNAATLFPVKTELVSIFTSDGVRLDGAFYTPEKAPIKPRVGILFIHGYAGNFYTSVQAFLPKAMAERGYPSLAINTRDHDKGPKTSLFEQSRLDIEVMVKFLRDKGYSEVVLVGHSMGTNRVLFYQAEAQDPYVKAVVWLAGPGNLFEWNARVFGRAKAEADLKEAIHLLEIGRGDELMLVDLGPLGKALYTPRHLVGLRGPATKSDPFQNVARVHRPLLIVQGTADRLVDIRVAQQLEEKATKSSKVDLVFIEGADHQFTRHQEKLIKTLYNWLTRVFPAE